MEKHYNPKSQLVRLVITGSVDDGKSTLVGRLLMDLGEVFQDQLKAIEKISYKQGMNQIDPSLLTDGLSAEREQKITIDVGYRYLNISNKRFIIADVPGHEQYTRNMISGASNANAALILVDVRKGLSLQSKRHLFIMALLAVKHIIVVINKMDLVDYNQATYEEVVDDFNEFASKLDISDLEYIPVSAIKGDMIVNRGNNMDWYRGAALIGLLENMEVSSDRNLIDFRLPVQLVISDNRNLRSYAGQVESGTIKTGERVVITPSMEKSRIKTIVVNGENKPFAISPQPVVLTLEDEVDISRGDIIVRENNIADCSNRLEAMVCWMDRTPQSRDRSYLLKHTSKTVRALIDKLVYRIDINDLHRQPADFLSFNEIGRIQLTTNIPLVVDPYTKNKAMGSFILIDDLSKQTVGAGIILGTMKSDVTDEHHQLKLKKGGVVWFTGLPSSGKSTLADALADELRKWDLPIERLDGDVVRQTISKDLGFSPEDRQKNIERVTYMAKLLARNGILVLASFISPQRVVRDWARNEIGNFVEVYTKCSLEECIKRDTRGNYEKALAGELDNFTGISDPYEEPIDPELIIETSKADIDQCVKQIISKLEQLGYLIN